MSRPSTARAQPVASSCRVSLRHERQVGNASNHRRRAANTKPATATMESHRVALQTLPSSTARASPAATSRRASSRIERRIGIASNLAADESRAQGKLRRRRGATQAAFRRHRYRRREARLAAPSCRVSARNMRRVGNSSKRRRRVVNIKPPRTSRRASVHLERRTGIASSLAAVELRTPSKPRRRRRAAPAASSDATAIDSESMACRLKLSILTQRAAGWQCQSSPPTRRVHKAANGDDKDPHE